MLLAIASAAQQRAAASVPDDGGGGLRLMGVLLRNKLWWTGTLCDAGGFVCQAAALGVGSLLLVQPMLVTTLLFALPLGARWAHRRLRRSDWVWAGLLAVALATFVISGEPTAGIDRAPPERWLPAGWCSAPCSSSACWRPRPDAARRAPYCSRSVSRWPTP